MVVLNLALNLVFTLLPLFCVAVCHACILSAPGYEYVLLSLGYVNVLRRTLLRVVTLPRSGMLDIGTLIIILR